MNINLKLVLFCCFHLRSLFLILPQYLNVFLLLLDAPNVRATQLQSAVLALLKNHGKRLPSIWLNYNLFSGRLNI